MQPICRRMFWLKENSKLAGALRAPACSEGRYGGGMYCVPVAVCGIVLLEHINNAAGALWQVLAGWQYGIDAVGGRCKIIQNRDQATVIQISPHLPQGTPGQAEAMQRPFVQDTAIGASQPAGRFEGACAAFFAK